MRQNPGNTLGSTLGNNRAKPGNNRQQQAMCSALSPFSDHGRPAARPQGVAAVRSLCPPGQAACVVRTGAGVGVLRIQVSRVSGSGRLLGQDRAAQALLGRARAALALLKARAADGHLAAAVFDAVDIQLQVTCDPLTHQVTEAWPASPAQARDGDLALFLALASLFSGRPLRSGLLCAAALDARGQLQRAGDTALAVAAALQAGRHTLLLPLRSRPGPALERGPALRCLWLATVDEALHEALPAPGPVALGPAAGG